MTSKPKRDKRGRFVPHGHSTRRRRTEARLDGFLRKHALKPARVARVSGISRGYLLRLRKEEQEPSRRTMVKLAHACGKLLGRPVFVSEMFAITPESFEGWR